MDQKLPKKSLVFITFLTFMAILLTVYTFFIMDWTKVDWIPILIFLVLIIISESFPVTLPKGGNVTVSFATIAASIILFQPFIVIIISITMELFLLVKENNRIRHLFNSSQLAFSTGTAALVYNYFSPATTEITLEHLMPFVLSILTFFILNIIFVTLILSLTQQEKPVSVWMVNIKWASFTFLSMAPLGALIAVIYINIGFWGLVLFLLPLIIARHSFQSYMNMREAFLDTITSLSLAIDAKDPYTKGHSSRVADYVTALGEELNLPADRIEFLHYIAMIHDVGKLAIPENILKKEAPLSPEEDSIMKKHSEEGAKIIKNVKYFAPGSDIIKYHHERWDGSGYPSQLKAEAIPQEARILSVADAFDAMTSDRPYRKAMKPQVALRELQKCSGAQFDPEIVNAFATIFPRLCEKSYKDSSDLAKATREALTRT